MEACHLSRGSLVARAGIRSLVDILVVARTVGDMQLVVVGNRKRMQVAAGNQVHSLAAWRPLLGMVGDYLPSPLFCS